MKPTYIKSIDSEIDAGTRYIHVSKTFVYNVQLGRFLFSRGSTYSVGARIRKNIIWKRKQIARDMRRALKKTLPTGGINTATIA